MGFGLIWFAFCSHQSSLPMNVFVHSGEFSRDDWRAVSYGKNVIARHLPQFLQLGANE